MTFEGFHLGPYADIPSIRPKARRLEFINQFYTYLDQKRLIRCDFDDAYGHTKYSVFGFPYEEADREVANNLTKERYKYLHHSDDEFIQGIILQRKEMIARFRDELCRSRDKQLNESQAEDMRKWEMNHDAMERTAEREKEREEERAQHQSRVNAANAEVQVYVYKRRKRRELRAARKAKEDAQFAAHKKWKADQKKKV